MRSGAAIRVEQVSKVFSLFSLRQLAKFRRPPRVDALSEVSFELRPGESLCILGPNASGKTTLLKLIATLLWPNRGRIWVNGHDTLTRPMQARRHLGLITSREYSFFGRLNGRQNLTFFARLHDLDPHEAVPRVVKELDLEPYLERRFFSYSTGIKRRFDIARGLLHQPDILLMDEPTTNLDPLSALMVRDLVLRLKGQEKTIVMVTHRLEEVEKLGGRLAIMKDGRLKEVSPRFGEDLESLYRRVVLGEGNGAP